MAVDVSNYYGATATDRGTKIANSSDGLDRNAFLTILCAELSNLDPTADVDSTQYVTQLAQFSTMEQMSNLNTTMANTAAYDLVGKGVTVNSYDSNGNLYTGIVRGVSGSNGNNYTISLEVYENGESAFIEFPMSSILMVLDSGNSSDTYLNSMSANMGMMTATSYIGKYVELSTTDSENENVTVTGKVLSVVKSNGMINIKVQEDGTGEIKEYSYGTVVKVQDEPII